MQIGFWGGGARWEMILCSNWGVLRCWLFCAVFRVDPAMIQFSSTAAIVVVSCFGSESFSFFTFKTFIYRFLWCAVRWLVQFSLVKHWTHSSMGALSLHCIHILNSAVVGDIEIAVYVYDVSCFCKFRQYKAEFFLVTFVKSSNIHIHLFTL